jgi:hypothetical protein
MTAVAAKKTVARKTAAPKGMTSVPLDVVAKGDKVTETTPETVSAVVVDPDIYVAPTAVSDGFVSTGTVPLDRLSKRAVENLTELAKEGNTDSARKHWIARLAQYGITVPFVPVDASPELVSA